MRGEREAHKVSLGRLGELLLSAISRGSICRWRTILARQSEVNKKLKSRPWASQVVELRGCLCCITVDALTCCQRIAEDRVDITGFSHIVLSYSVFRKVRENPVGQRVVLCYV